jgi:hypothetical protein
MGREGVVADGMETALVDRVLVGHSRPGPRHLDYDCTRVCYSQQRESGEGSTG